MNYESKTYYVYLALIGFLGGVLPISLPIRNSESYFNSKIVVYAKETKSLEEPKSDRYAIPKSIIRFNRRTGKLESVSVPKETGEAICSKDWPCEQALRVASCESDFSTSVVGPTRDVGLFQINPVHGYTNAQLFDRGTNINIAYKLWKARGWQPWKSSFKCHHTK